MYSLPAMIAFGIIACSMPKVLADYPQRHLLATSWALCFRKIYVCHIIIFVLFEIKLWMQRYVFFLFQPNFLLSFAIGMGVLLMWQGLPSAGTPNGGKVYPKLLKRLFNSHFLSISVYTIFKEEKIRRKRLENGERRDWEFSLKGFYFFP